MKICMLGLGSIGAQHTKNLAHILKSEDIPFQIDALRIQNHPPEKGVSELIADIYSSFEVLPNDYDVIFINTPTNLHFQHLSQAIHHAKHIFVEKPVFDKTDYNWQAILNGSRGVYYVACPLRYHRVIAYLKCCINKQKIFSARAICSSYLPDWRPGTDYRTCYSAIAAQGGGVRIDLIHEWDYLIHLFGMPDHVSSLSGTYSNLEITSEDLAVYIAEYPETLLSLHLDYFGRVPRREIELYTAEDVLIGDLIKQEIRFIKSGEVIVLTQSRVEMQRAELVAFLAMVREGKPNKNTIENAVNTMRIAMEGIT